MSANTTTTTHHAPPSRTAAPSATSARIALPTMNGIPSLAYLTSRVRGSEIQLAARETAICLKIAEAGRGYDLRRQRRCRRVAVPPTRTPLGVEPITQRLLVEARLRATGDVAIGGPEPRAVGRQRLVDEDDAAVAPPELELRVGDDD